MFSIRGVSSKSSKQYKKKKKRNNRDKRSRTVQRDCALEKIEHRKNIHDEKQQSHIYAGDFRWPTYMIYMV